ncbi:SDR family NAD(P)-dependent oxidoreductase [Paenibacillus thalictri]|uniref:SDR family NAD(P)-dependent oxidoreductase n=1 Tax=Paenibacillus thalictri TaxID=2527873 RepID=A0A4Q9DI60_9BACL|nr:SDR family NAD(P)-dependent oxidoreductase [Paenibacillus thalictri]TBL70281.1 SDR family NAD(P)-dependent oxidoreductase [Paenibacillus thalictri]
MENNRWALVTGADRGLGLALAKGLLAQGYHVWAGQYAEECQALQELKAAYGKRLRPIRLDISDAKSVAEALHIVTAETEQLDLLINNGAILGNITSTIQDKLDFADIEQVFRVNTLGALRMTNGLIDLILKSTDKIIVNISSEAGSIGACKRTAWYAYCMSKAALNMQSQLIHNQISPQGGKVLVVYPGHVQTFMKGKLDTSAKLSPEQSAQHILGLLEQRLSPDWPDQALALIDYQGEHWPW